MTMGNKPAMAAGKRPGAGRPKLTGEVLVMLGVNVRPETKAALEKYAEENDYSQASVVRMALRQFLGLPPMTEKKIK